MSTGILIVLPHDKLSFQVRVASLLSLLFWYLSKDAYFTFFGSDCHLDGIGLRSSSPTGLGCHDDQVQVWQWHFYIV